MADAKYRNFGHYIRDGWSAEPKQTFVALADHLLEERGGHVTGELLDIGCATGELIGYLSTRFPQLKYTGVDLIEDVLVQARVNLPGVEFVPGSALALPPHYRDRFDIVTVMGVASVFDDAEIEAFWRSVIAVAKPGGTIAVLSPLNEYGVDTVVRHRKRRDGAPLAWETGWNVYAIETIQEMVTALGASLRLERFRFQGTLERRPDPVRTWTLATAENPQQLTNGLKLLVDHYFMLVRKPARAAEGAER
jgi:SAM-dependent methyltransferase